MVAHAAQSQPLDYSAVIASSATRGETTMRTLILEIPEDKVDTLRNVIEAGIDRIQNEESNAYIARVASLVPDILNQIDAFRLSAK